MRWRDRRGEKGVRGRGRERGGGTAARAVAFALLRGRDAGREEGWERRGGGRHWRKSGVAFAVL